jgi:hypothetical protein
VEQAGQVAAELVQRGELGGVAEPVEWILGGEEPAPGELGVGVHGEGLAGRRES